MRWMAGIEVLVKGRVQGVGFRHYVSRLAWELGLNGEVWNVFGGGVRVNLQSADTNLLDQAVAKLWQGPGQVEEIEVTDVPDSASYQSFCVTQSRPG